MCTTLTDKQKSVNNILSIYIKKKYFTYISITGYHFMCPKHVSKIRHNHRQQNLFKKKCNSFSFEKGFKLGCVHRHTLRLKIKNNN